MVQTSTIEKTICYHCGEDCNDQPIWHEDQSFCCFGCQTVYELLSENDLCDYYTFEKNPGNQLSHFFKDKYLYLDDPEIVSHLLDFESKDLSKVTLDIPSIHCSSCIWLLENIRRFDQGIIDSKINFSRKTLLINFNPEKTTLRKVADLLYQLSYEPDISLNQQGPKSSIKKKTKDLKIGIAGFCFGNIMLLAFPDYLGIEVDSEFIAYFTYISLGLSLPVLFYCSNEFFYSAWSGLRKGLLNIDLPIAIGILALFGRSLFEIISETGGGYLDSLAALVFFLLIGRWVQSKTYEGLSFDRNFKSYFPLAVQRLNGDEKKSTLVNDLEVNELIEIRNEEIIPCDAILMSKLAMIDYSFVSGESAPNSLKEGDKIYAGGKIKGTSAKMTVIKSVSQSYLTQLWNHTSFEESSENNTPHLIDQISKYFTPAILAIALLSGIYWYFADSTKVLFVISSVLIVACPCALALAAPFTLSATMNTLGAHKMYLKSTQIIEKIWKVNRMVFDKTGTITTGTNQKIEWVGKPLSEIQLSHIHVLTSQSVHPLSQLIWAHTKQKISHLEITNYEETKGKGISGEIDGTKIKIGSSYFTGNQCIKNNGSIVTISFNNKPIGYFSINNMYRKGLEKMLESLAHRFSFAVLSGDNETEKANLIKYFPENTPMLFNQSPEDKLKAIETFQIKEKTMMLGDGLNDAGALKSSFVGVSIAENMSSFTPASDIILLGDQLTQLPKFIALAKQSKKVIIAGFVVSFLYNLIGLSLAVAGYITPVIAAILMPLSSISVVLLSTMSIKWLSYSLKLRI